MLAAQNERIVRAVVGAACGFLFAVALVAANMPLLPGADVNVACVVVAILGALIALAVPVRWIAVLAAIAAIAVYIVAFTPLAAGRVRAWVRRDPPPTRPPDAVVVLATTISTDGLLDATGTTRLLSALEAMRQTGAGMLVTTRPRQAPPGSTNAYLADYRRIIGLAGDTSRWRAVGPVATTHDEAFATSQLLAPASGRSIVVVTSPLHTRRACATFEAVGFSVTCWPSDERRYALNTFVGIRTRIAALVDWLYERAAVFEYRWRGWMR